MSQQILLPLELSEQIIGNMHQTEFIGLLKTCRGLRTSLEPLMYRSISDKSFGRRTWSFCPPLFLLLRTLLTRPDLGQHIRHFGTPEIPSFELSQRQSRLIFEITRAGIIGFNAKELALLQQRARSLSIDLEGVALWRSLAAGNLEILNRLILSFCLDLRELFSPVDCRQMLVVPSLPSRIPLALNFSGMSRLKHVRILNPNHRVRWNSCAITSLFGLPMIQSIEISVCPGSQDDTMWPNIDTPTPQKLSLVSSSLYEKSLRYMVQSASNLRTLSLDLVWDNDPTKDYLPSEVLDFARLSSIFQRELCQDWRTAPLKVSRIAVNTLESLILVVKAPDPWTSGRTIRRKYTQPWHLRGTWH
ncbi:hypothetical protein ONS95_008385 [Cadophora gregata]|uniref:uncharacterized protein n=1 Tax=Cadophora gregata TaxID=51156 RepID=UPI0026DAC0B0|nr:uncharacterized protein ONS95_008385 [Cadophora gregata]KAK0126807.1 hypothetical protein ONS95_008385 [Cadophora gregata]